jgi:hypothetical protein
VRGTPAPRALPLQAFVVRSPASRLSYETSPLSMTASRDAALKASDTVDGARPSGVQHARGSAGRSLAVRPDSTALGGPAMSGGRDRRRECSGATCARVPALASVATCRAGERRDGNARAGRRSAPRLRASFAGLPRTATISAGTPRTPSEASRALEERKRSRSSNTWRWVDAWHRATRGRLRSG